RVTEIHGSDLSPDAIKKARAGVYGAHALRATSQERLARFFTPQGDGRIQVNDEVKAIATFDARPILDEPSTGPLYDVILCRNVLIYFDEEARRRAADRFASRLKTGGYLLLGPSDALAAAATPLTLVRLTHDVAYRK
ncbi:MAG TPA: CheR family methyltransferase, partial [Thermoanaerobaculia bacterium]|nr:CheR family methyltransferase [Thermoanaerobaculia bacterium]